MSDTLHDASLPAVELDRGSTYDDDLDDRRVVFERPGERLIHVHRANIAQNVRTEWTRPTILVAAEGQTPVFAHRVLVRGPVQIVERPPGVHIVLGAATVVVALDRDGTPIPLPAWAEPERPCAALDDVAKLEALLSEDTVAGEALGRARALLARIWVQMAQRGCGG